MYLCGDDNAQLAELRFPLEEQNFYFACLMSFVTSDRLKGMTLTLFLKP